MPKSERLSARIERGTRGQIDWLAKLWGPVRELSDAEVVAEAVRRCHVAEHKAAGKKIQNPGHHPVDIV